MNFKGVIFDLDGVLVDTASCHFEAWKQLADELEIPFTEKQNEQLKGVSRQTSLNILLSLKQPSDSYTEQDKQLFMKKKNDHYLTLIEKTNQSFILPGAKEAILYLKDKNVKIILGSASKNARKILEKTGLLPYFDAIIDGNQVKKAKPDPEVFTKGRTACKLPPEKCLVVEDSEAGCQAAKAAGMLAMGIGHPENLPTASIVIPSMLTFIDSYHELEKKKTQK
ncbi:beta-phosphoglucomutase [Enterococcus faecalis 13-SD-W-01]|nr:beta-phosphoglucomutase [Enterococcus faecalis 13-SD-W-01]